MNPDIVSDIHSTSEDDWPLRAPEQLAQALIAEGHAQTVAQGDRLFSFGQAADRVFLIVKGMARAVIPGKAGHELVSRTAGPGSVLGLPSALCSMRYQFDVEALAPVEAVYLEIAAVNEILRREPGLCMQVMAMMCNEMTAMRQTQSHMKGCSKQSCALYGCCTGMCQTS